MSSGVPRQNCEMFASFQIWYAAMRPPYRLSDRPHVLLEQDRVGHGHGRAGAGELAARRRADRGPLRRAAEDEQHLLAGRLGGRHRPVQRAPV